MGTGTLVAGTVPNFGTDRAALDGTYYGYNGFIPFAYMYDMDLDGRYEIIAGGKIYYDLDTAKSLTASSSSRYKILSMAGVPDGRTGVADINGDGIPDVVTINRFTVTSTSYTYVRITVWDPGFLMHDANGNVVPKYTPNATTGYNDNAASTFSPQIIAQLDLPLRRPAGNNGSNSYVFIGDIDGREQVVVENGVAKSYRLPEIAVMAGFYYFNSGTHYVHPNVSGIATAD